MDQSAKTSYKPSNIYVGWVILTVCFLLLAVISFVVTTEDAYISFRYVENIANGDGPVFNVGGESVEGYSNPTWTGLLAIAKMLGFDTVNAARCLELLLGALVLLEIMLLFKALDPTRSRMGLLAAIAVATAPAFIFWIQTGLENSLFLYFLMLGWRLATIEDSRPDRFPYSAIPLFLLAITRPEGIMYSVIIGAWKLVKIVTKYDKKSIYRLLLWSALILIPFAIFLIWRYSIFEAWVPNTFFAKVRNGIRHNLSVGIRYMIGFFNHTAWMPVIILLVLGIFRSKYKPLTYQTRRVLLVAGLMALSVVAFILYVGGDIHPNDRFGVPLLIFAAVAAFLLVPDIGNVRISWWKRVSTWVVVAFVLGNLAYSFPPSYGITPPMRRPPNFLTANLAGLVTGWISPADIWSRFINPPVDSLEFVGRDLKENPDVNGLLAAEQCGKIPYFYKGPVLDLLGLNDTELAQIIHSNSTWDVYAEVVLSHCPDVFVMVYRQKHFISRYYIENTILSEPFRNRYRLDAIYHIDHYFKDILGIEHTFYLELVRYLPISDDALTPLTEEEIAWCSSGINPTLDNPDALSDEIEAFRAKHEGDVNRIITFRVDLN